VEESGDDGGFPNNRVVIMHDDNTYAHYMHLTKNGALVHSGDEVVQGDSIGLSGNTGLAGFPHLHFVVTEKPDYPYVSIPTTFSNTLSNQRSLAPSIPYPAYSY
ncbi:MAG: M23 family metallopeptidase, partial [Flavobacteriaceae bacterium]